MKITLAIVVIALAALIVFSVFCCLAKASEKEKHQIDLQTLSIAAQKYAEKQEREISRTFNFGWRWITGPYPLFEWLDYGNNEDESSVPRH